MSILDFLRSDGSIVINKKMAHKLGLNATIILAEVIALQKYWEKRGKLDKENMFFCTIEDMQEHTTLKKDTQSRAIKVLVELGLITTKQKSTPSKRYFKIHEEAITAYVLGLREDSETLGSQNAKPDNGADQSPQKDEKPDNGQVSQIENPRERNMRIQENAKSEGNNTDLKNTYSLKQEEDEEEESPPTRSAGMDSMIEMDIKRLKAKYPRYQEITQEMAKAAKEIGRPIYAEEEYFLERADQIPVHEATLLSIYNTIKFELDRSRGATHAYTLIDNVFANFHHNLEKDRIKIDLAKWFLTTWTNERISLEQKAMMKRS